MGQGAHGRRLNPCCNGMKIEYNATSQRDAVIKGLNPCCNGMKIE